MQPILFVSGTRPEIIKLAPLYHALKETSWANVQWLHTGQHSEMAAQILACFDIAPDILLTRQGETLLDFSTGCRLQLERVMAQQPWSLVVVQGDTESAFLGAMAGFYNHVPVAHVEAGLRTYNLNRPYPEEGLRQMLSRITTHHFAPTAGARVNLLSEGIKDKDIALTGNTVIDAQHWVCSAKGVKRMAQDRGHLLLTVHRRENWGDDVEEICHAVADIAAQHPTLKVLFPVHLNPIIQTPVHRILGGLNNVVLTPPLDYLQMQQALIDACLVLTDSGGLQEEAPTFGIPVLVLRDETERPEAVAAGCAVVIGARRKNIVNAVNRLLTDELAYRRMQQAENPFGNGTASQKIVAQLALRYAPETALSTAMTPAMSYAA
jgi:UDP-N-acetylglucosamine 2-epimerase (non-hydrolysing)